MTGNMLIRNHSRTHTWIRAHTHSVYAVLVHVFVCDYIVHVCTCARLCMCICVHVEGSRITHKHIRTERIGSSCAHWYTNEHVYTHTQTNTHTQTHWKYSDTTGYNVSTLHYSFSFYIFNWLIFRVGYSSAIYLLIPWFSHAKLSFWLFSFLSLSLSLSVSPAL